LSCPIYERINCLTQNVPLHYTPFSAEKIRRRLIVNYNCFWSILWSFHYGFTCAFRNVRNTCKLGTNVMNRTRQIARSAVPFNKQQLAVKYENRCIERISFKIDTPTTVYFLYLRSLRTVRVYGFLTNDIYLLPTTTFPFKRQFIVWGLCTYIGLWAWLFC